MSSVAQCGTTTESVSGCWLWQVTVMSSVHRVLPLRPCGARTLPSYSPLVNRCPSPPGYGMCAHGPRRLPVALRRDPHPIRPRASACADEVASLIFLKALKRHGASGCVVVAMSPERSVDALAV